MILEGKTVLVPSAETIEVPGYNGHTVGRIWGDLYQYSGRFFNVLGGIAFTIDEMKLLEGIKTVELVANNVVYAHLSKEEIMSLGKWKYTKWGKRFVVAEPDWHADLEE